MPPRLLVTIEYEGRPRLVLDVLDEREQRRLLDWLCTSSALPEAADILALFAELLDRDTEAS